MSRCQCMKSDGNQCGREASQKPGTNPKFCWQHQTCDKTSPIQKTQVKQPIRVKQPIPLKQPTQVKQPIPVKQQIPVRQPTQVKQSIQVKQPTQIKQKIEKQKNQQKKTQQKIKKKSAKIESLPVITDGSVITRENIINNPIIKFWTEIGGSDMYFLLVENKYIVAGSGVVSDVIDETEMIKLRDDGNGLTHFVKDYQTIMVDGVEKEIMVDETGPRKVTAYANDIDSFIEQLPKGQFGLYAVK